MSATINAMTNEKHAKKGQYVLKQRTNNPSDSEAESSSPLFDGDVNTGLKDEVAKHLTSETINANTGTSRVTAKSLNRLLVLGVTTTVGLILLFAIAGKNDSQAASTAENLQISTTGHDSGLRIQAGEADVGLPVRQERRLQISTADAQTLSECADDIANATLKKDQVSLSDEIKSKCCPFKNDMQGALKNVRNANGNLIYDVASKNKKIKKKAAKALKLKFKGFSQVCRDFVSPVEPMLNCDITFEDPDFRSELDFRGLCFSPNGTQPSVPDTKFNDTILDYCLIHDGRIRYNRERKEKQPPKIQDEIEIENRALRKAKDQCVEPFLQTCSDHVIAYHDNNETTMSDLWIQRCCRIGTIDTTDEDFADRFKKPMAKTLGVDPTSKENKGWFNTYRPMIDENCKKTDECAEDSSFVQFKEGREVAVK